MEMSKKSSVEPATDGTLGVVSGVWTTVPTPESGSESSSKFRDGIPRGF